MDFCHLIVTCLFSMLRLPFDNQKVKGNYAILIDKVKQLAQILILPPVSFLDMISLEKNAKLIMTDSGGVQKEAFFYEKPCIILRSETEWVEIVENNAGIIADADFNRIVNAYNVLSVSNMSFPQLFGNSKAANIILDKIVAY